MAEVVMPQMGESIVEGTITKWLKGPGDKVERDEVLFEISTDKVDSEVPSPDSGVLEAIFFPEGETVEINTVVAVIGDGSKLGKHALPTAAPATPAPAEPAPVEPAAPPEEAEPTRAAAPEPAAADSGKRIHSSPLVRRIAKEKGIDLATLGKGTGAGGRLTKKDILAYIESQERAVDSGLPATAFPPAPEARFGDFDVEPLSAMRRSIAEHMVRTKRTSPHVSTVHAVDCTNIAKLRNAAKDKFLEQNGTKLTFLPFFLQAAASALKAYPTVNASLDGKQLIKHNDVNIGIAVALDWGLIVPVIRKADELSLLGIQRAVNDLAARARSKALKPDEISQGTFSVSNYGSYNSLLATPAINQPQVAILGIGAVNKTPVVINDAIAIRSMAYLTLSFDHRVMDGAIADLFLEHIREIVENWSTPVL
ncbi:MAG: 2-oxo acid dehydrogenase subunit E2 [Acidobacteriia bacterium]|nr:2-oxo acid dehydrogenase subunit E2 [Terriglobia bacterium]MYG04631.1 2-oxo acid dehydrogenase subunit E2 [Terriglobia bacterium]MYK08734.1 2-oxo acid dehydrogenase subunit E2 [Terriglobia bacterium]